MANFVIIGRVSCFIDDCLYLDVPHVLEAQAPVPFLPPHLDTEVVLPLAVLPPEATQEDWYDAQQWVIVEADEPGRVLRDEGEWRLIRWQGISVRLATEADRQQMAQMRRERKAARQAERERRRAAREHGEDA